MNPPILLPPALLELLRESYALGPIEVTRRFDTNGRREAYQLETQAGPLVLKLTDPGRPQDVVDSDTAILAALERHSYPAPPPFPTRAGQLFLPYEDRFFYLYHYIEGHKPVPSAAMLANLGALLARLHSLPLDGPARISQYRPANLLDEVAGYLRAAPDEPEQQRMAAELMEMLTSLPAFDGLPEGLIHTDPYFVNLVQGPAGLHLIDWEDAGISYPLLDVGYLGHLTTYLPHDRVNLGLSGSEAITWRMDWAQAFLDGYQSVRVLTPLERQLFPAAVRLSFLVYIWDWGAERIIPQNYQRLKLLTDFQPRW